MAPVAAFILSRVATARSDARLIYASAIVIGIWTGFNPLMTVVLDEGAWYLGAQRETWTQDIIVPAIGFAVFASATLTARRGQLRRAARIIVLPIIVWIVMNVFALMYFANIYFSGGRFE